MTADAYKPQVEVACQQILQNDASVYSVQWLDFPGRLAPQLTASFLLERYLRFIGEWTRSIIRPAVTADGVEFRLLGSSIALLGFTVPKLCIQDGEQEACLRISGGVLVQAGECGQGMFSLIAAPQEQVVRVTVQLSDYCPLLLGSRSPSMLRKYLYRFTQAYIHKVVTVRFLARLYRELTGIGIRPVVKNVQVREGRKT